MVFFTVVMLVLNLILLVSGGFFHSIKVEIGEEEIKKAKVGTDNYKRDHDFEVRVILMGLYTLFMTLLYFMYFSIAISFDPYLYPTLILLTYMIIVILYAFASRNKKLDLTSDEQVAKLRKRLGKKRTFRNTMVQITFIIYFGYMLYYLVIN